MLNYYEKVKEKSYQAICNMAGNIRLRPNDHKLLMGEEKYNAMIEAYERVLEEKYKHDDIYKYYYELPKVKHGFCTFERWKRGLLF